MGLLKHLRSRSKLKDSETTYTDPSYPPSSHPLPSRPRYGQPSPVTQLPDRVLARIFLFVCPHTRDTSFFPSEASQIGDGCMLCDLRDLARCAQVSRKWYSIAQGLLYRSVRIDAVHYCELEEELADKRKKSAKFRPGKKEVEPLDIPHIRLQLFARSVRENANLASQVQLLKLPYMTRETAKGDLARAVSALPNLQYVDLPDGFYSGDPSCMALRQELQIRCPDMRKMTYRAGSEEALELLAQRHWQKLEMLEIAGLAIEPATLRIVLASLPTLYDLTLSDLAWMDDSVFMPAAGQLPDFPPLQSLTMVNIPNISAEGLKTYLEAPQNRETFLSLTLKNTGLSVPELPTVLWAASNLQHLSITDVVSKSLGLNTRDLPPLASISLKTLHFEITSSDEVHGLQKPADSYYAYLSTSLHRNALPALETLYVRDQSFPDLLLMPPLPATPSVASFHSQSNSTKSKGSNPSAFNSNTNSNSNSNSNNPYLSPISPAFPPQQLQPHTPPPPGFSQKLEVFSKGAAEVEWVFTDITPPASHAHTNANAYAGYYGGGGGSTTAGSIKAPLSRPQSTYSSRGGLGPQWAQGGFGSDARKSVVVGNGFGGFLAVPQQQEEMPRPVSYGGFGSSGSGGGRDSRWSSVSSGAAGGGAGAGGFGGLKPPPSFATAAGEKRHSKRDMWR